MKKFIVLASFIHGAFAMEKKDHKKMEQKVTKILTIFPRVFQSTPTLSDLEEYAALAQELENMKVSSTPTSPATPPPFSPKMFRQERKKIVSAMHALIAKEARSPRKITEKRSREDIDLDEIEQDSKRKKS